MKSREIKVQSIRPHGFLATTASAAAGATTGTASVASSGVAAALASATAATPAPVPATAGRTQRARHAPQLLAWQNVLRGQAARPICEQGSL
jgi:hypothetical protein